MGCTFYVFNNESNTFRISRFFNIEFGYYGTAAIIGAKGVIYPSVIYNDNRTNFRGACKELKDEVKKLDVIEQRGFALHNGMKWVFNLLDTLYTGGAGKQLIRSVKTVLYVTLNNQASYLEVLHTLLMKIEHSINSVDPRDNEALTPNHFLIGYSSGAIDLGKYGAVAVYLRKLADAQGIAESFWTRWLREYLPTFLPKKKWLERELSLEVGEVVIIIDL